MLCEHGNRVAPPDELCAQCESPFAALNAQFAKDAAYVDRLEADVARLTAERDALLHERDGYRGFAQDWDRERERMYTALAEARTVTTDPVDVGIRELTAERDEWRDITQQLRAQESCVSGALCDAGSVVVDSPEEGIRQLTAERDRATEERDTLRAAAKALVAKLARCWCGRAATHEVHSAGPCEDVCDEHVTPGWRGNVEMPHAEEARALEKLLADGEGGT